MKYKIYSKEQHGISLKQIDKDALYALEKLRSAGYTSFLVGGSVRDLLLGKKPKDFDISTSAKPEEIKQLFRNCILIGRRFRLAHLRFGKKILEVSTFRSGDNETDALIVRDNDWGTPEQDVMRRDFTINGLFYDAETESVIDYVDGYEDITKKRLRTIGQAYFRFKQDPVRMLRLLKFQARFGLEVESSTRIALLECRSEITKSSQARVLEELLRMLESGAAAPFFHLLIEHGVLQLLLPSLEPFLEGPDHGEMMAYLEEIDKIHRSEEGQLVNRSVMMCIFIFPLLNKHIDRLVEHRDKIPHLGEILEEALLMIDTIFQPFFQIPRRMKACMASILTSQYRLTPIDTKKKRYMRIPSDPDFALGVDFLGVRQLLEPGLQEIYREWRKALETNIMPPSPRKRRRKKASG